MEKLIEDLLTKNLGWSVVVGAGLLWLFPKVFFLIRLQSVIPYRKAADLAHKKMQGMTTLQIENLVRKMQRYPAFIEVRGVIHNVDDADAFQANVEVKDNSGQVVTCNFKKLPANALELNKGDPIRIVGKLGVNWNEYRGLETSFVESRVV